MSAKPVYLYLTDTLADWECGHAIAHITKPDWQREPGRYVVRTVGVTLEPVTTVAGLRIVPDVTFADVDPAASAMLILPGADTWDRTEHHADALRAAQEFLAAGTPVAAICGATMGLALAGLLDDRAHTSNAAEFLASSGYAGGAHYREEPAVTDRGLITASSIWPVDFAAHIFAELDLYSAEVLAAWHGLFTTGDPKYYGTLMAA